MRKLEIVGRRVLTDLVQRLNNYFDIVILSERRTYVVRRQLHRSFAAKNAAQDDKLWRSYTFADSPANPRTISLNVFPRCS
jgi:hypothetical protein